jgi:hypothetical protein
MDKGQFRARLTPVCNGQFTRLQLTGVVPSSVPIQQVAKLVRALELWSGWSVECVLCVDRENPLWCEWWSDLLAGIPERRLKVRYEQEFENECAR